MKKVLIVDDAAIMRKLIRVSFEKSGFTQFEEAGTSEDAVRKAKFFVPDIVTMDIDMPDGSGIDVVDELKMINPLVKIIMITSDRKSKTVIDSVNAGANHYIAKPFSYDTFIEALKQIGEKP